MNVLILAAGYGTRLYPIIKNTPKALLAVAGKPIIDYLLEKVRGIENLKQVFVVTNDKFYENFQAWAKGHKAFPVSLRVVNDGTKTPDDRLGSVGDIHFVLKNEQASGEDLLVIGGDNLFDFSLKDYVHFARGTDGRVTIGVYDINDIAAASKFGVVDLDEKRKIRSFEEKPEAPKSSLIAMCLYYLPQASLPMVEGYLKSTQKSDKAGEYIKWLCGQKGVYGFKFQGKWYDIGSIESYQEAEKAFKQ